MQQKNTTYILKNIISSTLNIKRLCSTSYRLILLSQCIFLSSCSIFSPVTNPSVHKFQITYRNTTEPTCTNKNKTVLQVMPVRANAPYDTVRMYYTKSQYELDSYSYNQWVATPQSMISQAIEQKLLQSCIYTNVINSVFLATADYRLSTQILELKQVIKDNLSTITLITLVQLIDNSTNNVMKSKTFVESIDNTNSPEGFVIGANEVTQKFLVELTEWLEK
jgi:ABC-type uncharacterized transport system auxiliary subunit